ncbi:MAG: family 10 glycosylhydrolase [Lentisphaerae bacterium]|nr:family 10 glycosylhydrolase [Lentisphaerota bacterium]
MSILSHVEAKTEGAAIGKWQDAANQDAGYPAIILSPHGAFITQAFFFRINEDTVMAMMALLGHFVPNLWEDATRNVVAAGVGDLSYYHPLDEVEKRIAEREAKGQALSKSKALLVESKALMGKALKAVGRNPVKGYALARQAKEAAENAYFYSFPSKAGELRGIYIGGHGGHEWEQIVRVAKENGFNAVFPCAPGIREVLREVGQPSTRGTFGEAFAALSNRIEIAHQYGMAFHIENGFSLYEPPMDRAANSQGQKGRDCKNPEEARWPCFSSTRNRDIMKRHLSRCAELFDVDGLDLDGARYASENQCYCELCKENFERDAKVTLANWPDDVLAAPHRDAFQKWRIDLVTSLLADEIVPAVKKIKPWVMISTCARDEGLGVGQDNRAWLEQGIVDFVHLMNYIHNLELFKRKSAKLIAWGDGGPSQVCVMGNVLPSPVKLVDFVEATRSLGADGFTLYAYSGTEFDEVLLAALRKGITREDTVPAYLNPEVRFDFKGLAPSFPRVAFRESQPISVNVTLSTQSNGRKPIGRAKGRIELETVSGERVAALSEIEASPEHPAALSVTLPPLTKGIYRMAVHGTLTFKDNSTRAFAARSRFIHVQDMAKLMTDDLSALSFLLENPTSKKTGPGTP